MSLQVSLKLKLSKQIKKIKVTYNTFEKSTFDEYLICSLALRTIDNKNRDKEVHDYINDITGEGSLNAHFNNIYNRVKSFSKEVLAKIMDNSLIPTLKIDDRNRYDYYPQLNVSVFQKRIYRGDLGKYSNLPMILAIKEGIIDLSVDTKDSDNKPEQYFVSFDEKENVKIRLLNEDLPIDNIVFEESLCLDIGDISLYKGIIHDNVDGTGWKLLTYSALNNLFYNRNFFYQDGDHYLIRNDSARKTIISKVHGLYIYKEAIIPYQGNAALCKAVVDFLMENKTIGELKPKSILTLLRYADDKTATNVVNRLLLNKEEKEIALYGLDLMERGIINGWLISTLKTFLKYASGYQLNLIYQAHKDLNYSIEQLITIDKDILTIEHKQLVDLYYKDLEAKRDTIRKITGDITTKGLRERSKDLESDDTTKKFSKLCNRLIGHVNEGLDDVSLAVLEQWHKDALELQEISVIIQRRLEK